MGLLLLAFRFELHDLCRQQIVALINVIGLLLHSVELLFERAELVLVLGLLLLGFLKTQCFIR